MWPESRCGGLGRAGKVDEAAERIVHPYRRDEAAVPLGGRLFQNYGERHQYK